MKLSRWALVLPCGVCGASYRVPLSWIQQAHKALGKECPGTDAQACPYLAFGDLVPEEVLAETSHLFGRLSCIASTLGGELVREK